jgi:replicative DNA helicase
MTATPMPRDVPRETHTTAYVSTTPPPDALWSEDAERAVLAAILVAGAEDKHRLATQVATILKPAMFGRGNHRVIYEAMEALRQADVDVDPITLGNQLEADGTLKPSGGKEYLGGLLDEIPTTAHALSHARIVRERWKRREVTALAKRMQAMAADPTVAIEDVFQWASKSLVPLAAGEGEKGFRRIKDGLWATMERIEKRQAGTAVSLLSFGIPELDDRMNGGFERGEFIVVAGVPSCGKTTIVWNGLRTMAQEGHGAVGFVSAEMSEGMLLENMLAADAEVSRADIKKGTLSHADVGRLASAAGRLLNQAIYIDDTVMPDVEDVVNRCRLLKAKEPGLCAIGVDFIQLLQKGDRERGELQSATLTYIAYRLKAIALELNVAVIALAQPNDKQIEDRPDKRPQLRDLQGSAGMRQAADQIWLLFRPRMYNPSAPDTIEINVAKQKSGAVGTATLEWDGPRLRVVSPRLRALEAERQKLLDKPPTLLDDGGRTE